jgi:hypothetical protein
MFSRRDGERFNRGRLPVGPGAGALQLDSFSQASYAEGLGALSGVASFSQASQVDGSGATNADIITLTNVVWVRDSTSVFTRNDASILNGNDLTNANWTKSNCTTTATGNGTQVSVAETGASTPLVSQTIANAQFVAANQVPCIQTWWFKFVDCQFVVFQQRASTAVSRVWLDVQNGAIGTTDAGMAASVAPETRNGQAGFRFTITSTAVGGTLVARFQLSSVDGGVITAPGAGKSVIADDYTVDQKKVSAVRNRVTGSDTMVQATVNLQPGWELGANGMPCARGYGAQYMLDTDAAEVAVLTAAGGVDAEYTVFYVAEILTIDLLACIIGAGNSGQASNSTRLFGTSTTGAGRYTSNVVDDAAGTGGSPNTSSADQTADLHVGEWYTSSTGTVINMKKNGTAVALASSSQNAGNLTPNRIGWFVLPRATATSIFVGRIYGDVGVKLTPDSSINSTIRQFIAAEYAITVVP